MRLILFFIFLVLYNSAYAQPAKVLHKPWPLQYYFIDSLNHSFENTKPEGSIQVLKGLIKWATDNGDNELAGELQLQADTRTLHYNQKEAHELEHRLPEMIMEARHNKQPILEANALQLIAEYWNIRHRYSLALENYLSAYNIYNKYSPEEFPLKRNYIFDLSSVYYGYEDNENALKYLKEVLATPTKNDDLYYTANNSTGLCYRRMKLYDSAELYLRKVYDRALARNDKGWEGIAIGNIGSLYFYQQRYDEAIPLLEKDITLSLDNNIIRNAAGSMYMLARIYYDRHEYDKAEQLLTRALAICEKKAFWPDYPLAEQIFRQLYKVYAAKNDMRKAYLYADSALIAKDTNVARFSVLNLAKASERVEFMQHKLEAEQLAGQQKAQILIRNGLISAILLLTVIGILFINRQRLRQKKLMAEKQIADSELSLAASQLDNFRLSMLEKNNMIERFSSELERMKQGEEEQTDHEALSQLEQSTILTDEQWENFRALFEKVHKGFFGSLKKKIPDLTPAEVRFLALTKLKLSSKEMASMLGISTNAIRLYRHRLRKKLNLDKDDMIEELVESV